MPADSPADAVARPSRNFIQQIIDADRTKDPTVVVHTRFPPEPNGYLHIGHAKSICLNSGLAKEYGGKFNLRFDDTNPAKEEQEYVDSIIDDVRWLGADWEDRLFFASDYFDQLYEWAVKLINEGNAYVCDLNAEQMREYRGTLTEPGKNSPYRDRSPAENLQLFAQMKAGEFTDGSRTLRAKVDMASPNLNLRDPVMYRVKHAASPPHRRQVVHLSLVRLYPRAKRLGRRHYLFDLYAGIRKSSTVVRLVLGATRYSPPAAN